LNISPFQFLPTAIRALTSPIVNTFTSSEDLWNHLLFTLNTLHSTSPEDKRKRIFKTLTTKQTKINKKTLYKEEKK